MITNVNERSWIGRIVFLGSAMTLAIGLLAGEDEIENKGEPQPYLGVYVESVPAIASKQLGLDPDIGVVVEGLVTDGPAEKAGLEKHDILLKFDDQILIGTKQIVVLVRNSEIGSKHRITYLRGGEEQVVEVVLAESKPKKTWKMQEHGKMAIPVPPMSPTPPAARDVVARALMALDDPDVDIDVDRRMEFNEEVEVLFERVNSAMSGVDGFAMPTIVFKDEGQVFEFADETGKRYVIVGGSEEKELTIVDAEGEEVYCGPLDSEAKQKLPEKIRDRLPGIRSIVLKAPRAVPPPVLREEKESF